MVIVPVTSTPIDAKVVLDVQILTLDVTSLNLRSAPLTIIVRAIAHAKVRLAAHLERARVLRIAVKLLISATFWKRRTTAAMMTVTVSELSSAVKRENAMAHLTAVTMMNTRAVSKRQA